MFYTYHQNNSGGFWKDPAHYVIVEAPSAHVANAIAEDHGLYFDGAGDCPCCGHRWSTPWGDDSGTEKPQIYDDVITPQQIEGNKGHAKYEQYSKYTVLIIYLTPPGDTGAPIAPDPDDEPLTRR